MYEVGRDRERVTLWQQNWKRAQIFFIFTEFVEVEQCEIEGVKEQKPDPESDLQLEL